MNPFFPVLFLFDWVGVLRPQLSKVLKPVRWAGSVPFPPVSLQRQVVLIADVAGVHVFITQSKRKRTGKKGLKGHGPEHVYNTLSYIKHNACMQLCVCVCEYVCCLIVVLLICGCIYLYINF